MDENDENIKEICLDNRFTCIIFQNNQNTERSIKKNLDVSYIQFHFCLKGNLEFVFNDGRYTFDISKDKYLILYNPEKELPLNINLKRHSTIISFLIPIEEFHKLFSKEGEGISFLNTDNFSQKYYHESEISNSILLVLNQIVNYRKESMRTHLYLKAKIYEIFSLIFDKNEEIEDEKCPFIMNDDQLRKIRLAKEIIIDKFYNPPKLLELSQTIGLSLRKLKTGFKQIYGKPVFEYLFEYKMEIAKKLLVEGKYNVNEVSLKLGYSTASHFIAAFKKRFGLTPRAYMLDRYTA